MAEHLLDDFDVGSTSDRHARGLCQSWWGWRSGIPIAAAATSKALRTVATRNGCPLPMPPNTS